MKRWTSSPMAVRLARRELRGGLRGFGVFLACLFLGVFAVTAVGSLSAAARRGLAGDARALLGGDLEASLAHRPLSPEVRSDLADRGEVSEVVRLRGMVRPVGGGRAVLAEVKGVDRAYPLYGEFRLRSGGTLSDALAWRDGIRGAVVEESLLARTQMEVGERLRLGSAEFEIRAVIEREPDRSVNAFALGPRLMVALEGLRETGLLTPGSLFRHLYRVRLPDGADAGPILEALREKNAEEGWRLRGHEEAAPRVRFFLQRMTASLTLVGLSALLIGGLGIAGAVRGYLGGRMRHLAAMKCLGAPAGTLFAAYALQILVLSAAGTGAGLLAGGAVPYLVKAVAGQRLPLPLVPALEWGILATAAAFGLLTAALFSLPALGRARRVSPVLLFRIRLPGENLRPGGRVLLGTIAAALLLGVLAIATSEDRRLAFWFVGGASACFLLFRGLSAVLVAAAGRARRSRFPALRLAMANIHRPDSPAGHTIFSLGLGLTALVAVALVQADLQQLVSESLPEKAPAFFFFDIQPQQVEPFERTVASVRQDARVERSPTLRGRITAIDGVPVAEAEISPEVSWAVRGDRYLTYAARRPEGKIVEGDWWPEDYLGAPLLSLSADLAEGFGVQPGDTLSVNVLGREVTAQIASIREADWSTLQLDFALIFSPGVLEGAPQTWIATVQAPAEAEDAIFAAVTERFDNISAVHLREVLGNLSRIFARIGGVFQAMAAVSLLAGFLVLAGALSADQHRRLFDAVVFKICGATRRDILVAFGAEFLLLGVGAGTVAAVVGSLAAWGVVEGIMGLDFVFRPAATLATLLGGMAVTLVLGLLGTWRVLSRPPARYLRNE